LHEDRSNENDSGGIMGCFTQKKSRFFFFRETLFMEGKGNLVCRAGRWADNFHNRIRDGETDNVG
jgi:hypothetical protein